MIVEAGALAAGASGRNAGFLLLGAAGTDAASDDPAERERAARLWALSRENAALVAELDASDPGVRLERVGSVVAAGSEEEAARLRASARRLDEATWVEPAELHRRLGARGFFGGLVTPEGGALDPVGLVRALVHASGAALVLHTRATALRAEAGGCAVETGRGTIRAPRAVVAANAYAPELVPELAGLVRPVRAQMLATAPVAPFLSAPVYSHDGYYYVRQRRDGRVLVGGARHLFREAEVGYADATTPRLQAALEAYLAAHFPAAAGAAVERRWSGTMGFSPDGAPVLADVPGVPGAVAVAGFSGQGLSLAVRLGATVAARVLGQPDAASDLVDISRLNSSENTARG